MPDQHADDLLRALKRYCITSVAEKLQAPHATDQPPAKKTAKPTTTAERPRIIEPAHQKLLAKAPPYDTPIPTKALIKAANYAINSWSREKVTDLVVWGDLVRHPRNRGVSLPPAA